MTNMIRNLLTCGVVVYLAIAVWQMAINNSVHFEAITFGVILLAIAGITWMKNEAVIKHGEMAMLWLCIILMIGYGVMTAGGLL